MDRNESDGLIPICGWCKKIRSKEDAWEDIEVYFTRTGLGEFTHSICPGCAEKIFSKRIYLESYQSICKAISRSLTLDEVLTLIVTNVVKVMNVMASSLRLLNAETEQLELVAYHGLSEKYANKGPVDYDRSISDAMVGKPVSIYDITSDPNARYRDEALEEGIRSIISIPLRFGDEVIGVLRMYTSEPLDYSGEELKFLTAIAEQAAIAIVNARVFEKTVSKEKEYLKVFQEVSQALSSSLQLNEVLDMIVKMLPNVMKLRAATIRLLDETRQRLELVAAHGLSEEYLRRGPVDMELNVKEALQEKPVAIYDVLNDPRVYYRKEAEAEGIRSMLTLPIIARSRIIGILRLLSAQPRHFPEQDVDFAAALAVHCGTAIENARMYGKQYKEAKYLAGLQDISKAVSSTLGYQEVMDLIVEKIAAVMDMDASTIRLLDPSRTRLELVASYGLSDRYLNKGPVDAEKSVTEALGGKAVVISDAPTDPRIVYKEDAKREGICSMLVVPMTFRGRVIGVIRILTRKPRDFHSDEIEFATAMAEQAAIAIEYAKTFS